mgnify:CR=1 FL=1
MSALVVRALGQTLTGRWPTLDEIAAAADRDPGELKKLAKACLPGADELIKEKPALSMKLGLVVLAACGVAGPLIEVQEEELEDGDPCVPAWAEAQKKGFERLHLVRYSRKSPAFDASFLMREPREREVDEYLANETFQASKAFAAKLCVFGDIDALSENAPGLVRCLSMFVLQKAGLNDDVLVGEA